jgi:CheY-like chemotaxis protein
VLLAVSDTGMGMPAEVQARAFEPFFTTKEVGRGTGLGLAMCYSIAKQFGGHVAIYSEVGVGTTMKVYLPYTAAVEEVSASVAAGGPHRGAETILLVEDEPTVRRLASKVLTSLGYTVLEAADATEALEWISGRSGAIDLLLTDVVLPKTGGRQLADQVVRLRPRTRVLFMSGYSDDVVLQHRLAERDVILVQKPFTADTLAAKVREALGQDRRGVAA